MARRNKENHVKLTSAKKHRVKLAVVKKHRVKLKTSEKCGRDSPTLPTTEPEWFPRYDPLRSPTTEPEWFPRRDKRWQSDH